MRKILIVVAALAFLAGFNVFAAVQNIKVSGDITTQGIGRNLSLGGDRTYSDPLLSAYGVKENSGSQEDYLIGQTRIKVSADLTENVSTAIRLLNERVWGTTAYNNVLLDLGYVELKDVFKDTLPMPVSFTLGRQELHYGMGMIIGDPTTDMQSDSNIAPSGVGPYSLDKAFDAVKMVADMSPYTLDAVFAKLAEDTTHNSDDVTLIGANLGYKWGNGYGITEGYLFRCHQEPAEVVYKGLAAAIRNNIPSKDKGSVNVVGLRAGTPLSENIIVGWEGAYQFGNYRRALPSRGTAHLKAWATDVGMQYRFLDKLDSKLGISFSIRSGDDADTKNNEAWDAFFEDQISGELLNMISAASNAYSIKITGSIKPKDDLELGLIYVWSTQVENFPDGYSEAKGPVIRFPGTYSPTSGSLSGFTYAIDNDKNHICDEIDSYLKYNYSEDVEASLNGAWFIPGGLLAEANDDLGWSLRGSLKVNF